MNAKLMGIWSRMVASRWAGLAGRAMAYLVAFLLLALVGSGRLARWLSPPVRLAIPTAAAATAPPVASAAPAEAPSPAVSASASADAGAPEAEADAGASSAVAPDGKVILNLATEQDLRRLPGIGPTRAKAIVELRTRLKRFSRVEDLLKIKGVGRRSIARLRPLVRVD